MTGTLLAGGQSSRFGSPKARLFSGDLLERLDRWCRDVLVSANDFSLFTGKGRKVVADRISGKGPLAGIAAAMEECAAPWLLVLSCDMPLVDLTAQKLLLLPRNENTRLVCFGDPERLYPFPGLYHRSLGDSLAAQLAGGKGKVKDFIDSLPPEEKMILPLERESLSLLKEFFNVNTRQDLEILQDMLH